MRALTRRFAGSFALGSVLLGSLSAQTVSRVSVGSWGQQDPLRHSWRNGRNFVVSADGRWIFFESRSTEFVPGSNSGDKIFRYDRATHETTVVSLRPDGSQIPARVGYPAIPEDARFLAFQTFDPALVGANPLVGQVYLRDLSSGSIQLISRNQQGLPGNSHSNYPSVSGDGRLVAFSSVASDIVPGDTNGSEDLFVYDRSSGSTQRVSLTPSGSEGDRWIGSGLLSGDGSAIVYWTASSNYYPNVPVNSTVCVWRELASGRTLLVSTTLSGLPAAGGNIPYGISSDGRFVAFSSAASDLVFNDTNGYEDVFVRDMVLGQTTRVSVDSNGNQGNGESEYGHLSSDGRWIVFRTYATNLVAGGSIGLHLIHDLVTRTTRRVTEDAFGAVGNHVGVWASISRDGSIVAFDSNASNLVPDDTNGVLDFYVRDMECPSIAGAYDRACTGSNGRAPLLYLAGCPTAGRDVGLWVRGALPQAPAAVLFGAQRGNYPFGTAGCAILVDQFFASSVLTLSTDALGNAGLGFRLPPVPGLRGDFMMQALVLDPGLSESLSSTRGIEVRVR